MTDRQKEMLKNRGLMEFLADYPDISMDEIKEFDLVKRIDVNKGKFCTFSHYAFFVRLMYQEPILYIPKERFRTKD